MHGQSASSSRCIVDSFAVKLCVPLTLLLIEAATISIGTSLILHSLSEFHPSLGRYY